MGEGLVRRSDGDPSDEGGSSEREHSPTKSRAELISQANVRILSTVEANVPADVTERDGGQDMGRVAGCRATFPHMIYKPRRPVALFQASPVIQTS